MDTLPRRAFLGACAAAPAVVSAAPPAFSLDTVKEDVLQCCESLRDQGGPYGCYRGGPGRRPDLYSSCDIAQIRAIMGENLKTSLGETQRKQWIDHINSFVDRRSGPLHGSYFDTYGHSSLHANGMVMCALGALGGRQALPVSLYQEFDSVAKVGPWLEKLDWHKQWGGSHLFWGGVIPFSFSRNCPAGWKEAVLAWLDANLDPKTGWWRRGVPHADRHQPLGGSVHILPVYQHHGRRFPYPERVIDSVLALQLENGRWLASRNEHVMSYLELDALYALDYMGSLAPSYRRADVSRAATRYAQAVVPYYREKRSALLALHPHLILAAVGTFGLLQRLAPEVITGKVRWTDIFSDRQFHQTAAVEAAG
jgi:hypothetical protein